MQPKFTCGLLAALAAVAAASSDVVDLQKDTFDDFIKGNSLVLAECRLRAAVGPRASRQPPR
jgi:protein disulfide-isomerase A1